jgi:hypothetical protein
MVVLAAMEVLLVPAVCRAMAAMAAMAVTAAMADMVVLTVCAHGQVLYTMSTIARLLL